LWLADPFRDPLSKPALAQDQQQANSNRGRNALTGGYALQAYF
jgi:hypothetical protein